MNDWINRFMEGKKKYSASVVVPIIVAIINALVSNPEQAQSLVQLVEEFLPTLIALIGGIVYTVVEGRNDRARIDKVTPLPEPQMPIPTGTPPSAMKASLAEMQPSTTPPIVEQAPSFDPVEFHEKVLSEIERRGMVHTPETEVICAEYVGRETPARNIADVYAYWNYLLDITKDALSYYENLRDEKGCLKHQEPVFRLRATYRTYLSQYNYAIANREAHQQWFNALHRDLKNLHQSITLFSI